ncbi:MAG: ATPase [Actinobacteria bacterium RBG_13_35_12]|uniref:ATPase n=1 Tax=Candidatus Sediminicultor quintus TaxID=1797291 RepID=A0A1F5AG50_9BACT|nr:MAG: ATPase [Actinobacteria bacterium RBG_13_35_12]OGD17388.1 MAG: ATPase [Candidatus Atribacteria bacterium RBG_19FT_COMBO_35_14]OGD35665.1 MAG: ATPase [Candidatus Atribacteria bacterium RBG_16_35_8]
MDKLTRYSAVNTKIRVMEKEFLKREDYLNMLKKKSVADAARYLKENISYGKLLGEIHPDTVSRRDLEDILKRNMIKNMDKLIHYFRDDYKDLIRSLYIKYEVEDLKVLARSIFNGKEPETIEKPLSFLGKYSRVDPKRLFKSRTIRELIYSLEGSEFFEFLIPLVDGRRENLFRFEMALDMGYFNIIQSRKLKISGEDREMLKKWEGMIADLYNIQWIYRGKKFYHLSPEELLNYTINFGDKLTFADRKDMCYTKNLEELYRMTINSVYGFLFKKEEISRDIYMERRINRFMHYKLRALTRRLPMSIIQTIGYVWLLEFEIRDIISIIESIRYDLPPEEARKFLVKAA